MEHGLQIGRFRVSHSGGSWVVWDSHGIKSKHRSRWEAITIAKHYNWERGAWLRKMRTADPGRANHRTGGR